MENTLIIFIILYFLLFVVYASVYSSSMQEINENSKRLKVRGVDAKKVQNRIDKHLRKVKSIKKWIWIPVLVAFLSQVFILWRDVSSHNVDYAIAVLMLGCFVVLFLITNWLKGAGTIDDNNRMGRSPSM